MKYSKVIEQHESRLAQKSGEKLSPFMAEVRRMSRGVSSLENLALSRNPKKTEAAHIADIASAARRLKAEADASNERIHSILRSKLIELDNAISEKAGMYVKAETAQEIRAALRSMPEKERMTAINDAVARGDGAVISAISGSSKLLTGISEDIAARSVEQLQRSKAADLVAERNAINDDFLAALAVIKDVNGAVRSGFDPERLQEIENAERQHAEASREFDGAFGEPA